LEKIPNILVATVDGSASPNPGLCRAGIIYEVVTGLEEYLAGNGTVLGIISKQTGYGTNNQSEYRAILTALTNLPDLPFIPSTDTKSLVIVTDSQLAANQLLGNYKVKSKKLLALRKEVAREITKFDKFSIVWQPRTLPRLADADALSKGGDIARSTSLRIIKESSERLVKLQTMSLSELGRRVSKSA
jgi:ribonuclease HI